MSLDLELAREGLGAAVLNRSGSSSGLFLADLGLQPLSATGLQASLQASPLRDGSSPATVAERCTTLARLLTRLSASAPSGSSVAPTHRLGPPERSARRHHGRLLVLRRSIT